jgi:protein pelota
MDEILTISSHIPGKYVDTSDRPALKSKYFGAIAEEVSRLLQREPAAIVAAGPGFTKNDLAKVLRERLKGAKVLEENTSSTGEPGVREVMARGALSKLMEDSTMLRDSRLVDEFLSRLSKSPNMVSYGAADVERTVDRGAVESLLVSEKLLKSIPPRSAGA